MILAVCLVVVGVSLIGLWLLLADTPLSRWLYRQIDNALTLPGGTA